MTTTMVTILVIIVVVVPVLVAMLVLALAVALALLLANLRTVAERAGSEGGPRDGRRGFREGVTGEGSAGESDCRTRENRSHELRIRHRHGFGDPPVHVVAGRGGTACRDHLETGSRQGAGPQGPDLEDPDPVR